MKEVGTRTSGNFIKRCRRLIGLLNLIGLNQQNWQPLLAKYEPFAWLSNAVCLSTATTATIPNLTLCIPCSIHHHLWFCVKWLSVSITQQVEQKSLTRCVQGKEMWYLTGASTSRCWKTASKHLKRNVLAPGV